MRTGIASFTLDYGKCPRWLFERMVRLGRVIGSAIIEEFGTEEFLRRLSDPVWFQSLGTVLAFDWNASGLTTTTLGALKVAFFGLEREYGVFICGGKGRTSRKTPQEIENWGKKGLVNQVTIVRLITNSRLAAKVDSSLIQDSFQIYHHNFIFAKSGSWTVIQQGMNTQIMRARRYHWFGKGKDPASSRLRGASGKGLIEEPHTGIMTQVRLPTVLDLTAKKSRQNRQISLELIHSSKTLYRDLKILAQKTKPRISRGNSEGQGSLFKVLDLPNREFSTHPVLDENFEKVVKVFDDRLKNSPVDFESPRLRKSLEKLVIGEPGRFDELLLTAGVGPKTIRALSLVGEIIYGAKPSYEDPARYSFAHGGKDGTPYPVDRRTYDQTLAVMERALLQAKLYYKEKDAALKRMEKVFRLR